MTEGPEPGAVIAGYRLVRVIGSGGMGTVFEAVEVRGLGRRVAVKVLAPEFADDPTYRERFLAEARAAGALDHPHIVPVYAAGEAGEVLFLAMRLIDGPDLGRVLKGGPLEPVRVAAIVRQLAEALDAAHSLGIVHGDVKPANVLLGQPGGRDQCYLTDFGVARRLDIAVSESPADGPQGTYAYMAPEVIEGRHEIDGRADGYSLACVAYEALAGAGPFRRDSPAVTMLAQIRDEAPGVADALRRPVELDRVLARQLAKDPAERYPTCLAFADRLGLQLGRRRRQRPRWSLVALAGAAILAMAAGAAIAIRQEGSGTGLRVGLVHFDHADALPSEPEREAVASITAGDVNGDGREDVIVARVAHGSAGPSDASIFIDDKGKFRDGTSQLVRGGLRAIDPRAVLIDDLTGDGHSDILIGDHGAPGRGGRLTFLVWEQGRQQFVRRPDLLPLSARNPARTTALAAADVNGDGLLDVFVDNGPGGQPSELLLSQVHRDGSFARFGSGASLLRSAIPPAPAHPVAAFVDVNGGVALVLPAGAHSKSTLELVFSPHHGSTQIQSFPHRPAASGPRGAATAIAQADLNSDGFPDLVIGWTGPGNRGHLQILKGGLYPAFQDVTATALAASARSEPAAITSITPVDLDADGQTDLAVGLSNGTMAFLRNDRGTLASLNIGGLPPGRGVPIDATGKGNRGVFVVRPHYAGVPESSTVVWDTELAAGMLAPPVVTMLQTPHAVTLSWSPVWGAIGYDVYASTSGKSPLTPFAFVKRTSYLVPPTRLPSRASVTYYTVKAVASNGTGPPSQALASNGG